MWKKFIIGVAALVLTAFVFLTGYKIHYSMDVAESFEVDSPEPKHRVLIASQGSEFKGAVVTGVVDYLKQRHAYIKVVDVAALAQVDTDMWDALVIIHTWEFWRAPTVVQTYLERVEGLNKVIVLTTSGRGDYKAEGVDAISSASVMANSSARTLDISNRLDLLLQRDARNRR